MRSASRGFQAECCEGSQVGIGELMGNRIRLQEVEVLLDRPAETGADKRSWAVVAMQIVEGVQLIERQPSLEFRLGQIVDLPQRFAEREA
ncbi:MULTISPECIES: hypothetical protein [Stenotrophomonas]|uniref:hypothetical protein n=1 Tax=Stenotrophomonas TaxID=40323 RepID=UPI0027E559F4|nr:hypothetical protein [Stenotrophomonas sp. Sm0581]MDQ7301878.1 hypothetical protein [Stenotrophomonas sp. Sm0581]